MATLVLPKLFMRNKGLASENYLNRVHRKKTAKLDTATESGVDTN